MNKHRAHLGLAVIGVVAACFGIFVLFRHVEIRKIENDNAINQELKATRKYTSKDNVVVGLRVALIMFFLVMFLDEDDGARWATTIISYVLIVFLSLLFIVRKSELPDSIRKRKWEYLAMFSALVFLAGAFVSLIGYSALMLKYGKSYFGPARIVGYNEEEEIENDQGNDDEEGNAEDNQDKEDEQQEEDEEQQDDGEEQQEDNNENEENEEENNENDENDGNEEEQEQQQQQQQDGGEGRRRLENDEDEEEGNNEEDDEGENNDEQGDAEDENENEQAENEENQDEEGDEAEEGDEGGDEDEEERQDGNDENSQDQSEDNGDEQNGEESAYIRVSWGGEWGCPDNPDTFCQADINTSCETWDAEEMYGFNTAAVWKYWGQASDDRLDGVFSCGNGFEEEMNDAEYDSDYSPLNQNVQDEYPYAYIVGDCNSCDANWAWISYHRRYEEMNGYKALFHNYLALSIVALAAWAAFTGIGLTKSKRTRKIANDEELIRTEGGGVNV